MQWDKFEGRNGLPGSTGCLRGGSLWICVMYGKLSLFPFFFCHCISFPLFWRGGRKGSRRLVRSWELGTG